MKMNKIVMGLICCMYASMAFGQKKEATMVVDARPLKTDSMLIVGEGLGFKIAPNKEGKFVYRFTGAFPKSVKIMVDQPIKGEMLLFLEAGDQLNINTDFADKTTFSGKGAENVKVQNEIWTKYVEDNKHIDAKGMSLKEFNDMIDHIEQTSIDILETNKQKVTPGFYKDQSTTLKYQKLSSKILSPYFYHMGFQKKLSESLPEGFWSFTKDVEMNDNLLSNESYNTFMRGAYPPFLGWAELLKQGRLDSTIAYDQSLIMRLKLIEQRYTGKVRNMAMNITLNTLLGMSKDMNAIKPLMDNYIAKYASAEESKAMQASYAKILSLGAGKTPPSFALKDLNGKEVTLKDFAGKVVYMDFWASWCSPCRFEMKNGSPKLHEKFKDNKDVVFLYISIDDKAEAWKKAIADDQIKGIHLLSAGGMNSPVAKAFNIMGVPRYVIIGKDGKIFDGDASRPSEDSTPARINEALSAQ
ncbi:TlpA disulfide reductase family protein [Pedobacter gandavensis]|uniref:TlpA family protein disulfide reductase n=1 Tax=Pedobacter gandavensis TaxID=2679963 RepID=UPI00293073A0|nr:TlpA disulfide reductase family protein [Pedobacter gandavensis]